MRLNGKRRSAVEVEGSDGEIGRRKMEFFLNYIIRDAHFSNSAKTELMPR